MYIDRRVYSWLKWIGYRKQDIVAEDHEQEAVQLTPQFTNGLFRAYEFKEILERVSILYEIPFIKQQVLSNITSGETVTQQRHNWELVIDFLAGVGFRMDQMLTKELQTPNEMAMRGFLADLMDFFPIISANEDRGDPAKDNQGQMQSELQPSRSKMGDRTFNENFNDTKVGHTTAIGLNKHEQHFKSEEVDRLDLLHIESFKDLSDLKSIPQIMIVSMSRNFGMQTIQAASLLTGNSRFFSLLIAKGLKGDFRPVCSFLREMIDIADHLVDLSLADQSSGTLIRLLQSFKSGLVSKDIEVARLSCKLYSTISHLLLDKASLDLAYAWFINPTTAGAMSVVLCLHRHVDLLENVTTLVVDIVKNHFESFFEESLPQLMKNDFQYFRFINTIFTSMLCRETTRMILERSGIVAKWCNLARSLMQSEMPDHQKTDLVGFLITCWLDLPDYFESIPDLASGLISWLSNTAGNSGSQVLHSICVARLAELLEKFSESKRALAPEIYRHMIALLLAADRSPTRRDRIIQAFIHIFLHTEIPSAILLDSYLPHFQSKVGIELEVNVFDLDFLKFLVRDKRIASRFKLMFFDVFCKILLSTSYGAAVFLEIVDLSADILASEQRSLTFKFFDVAFRFFSSTYKARKLTPGQTNDLQQLQAHRRSLVCRYFIALIRRLQQDQGAREVIKEKTLANFFDVKDFLEKDKKKGAIKAEPNGLKDILAQFGEVAPQLEEYMRANNIYYGSDMHANDTSKRVRAVGREDEELAKIAEEKLAAGMPVTQDERKALTKVQNAARIQAMKEKMRQPKKDGKEPESKLALYEKLREKGIVDDPVGVEKLEEFKKKLKDRQERQMEYMAEEKLQDMRLKENLHTLLQQRRVELGVESSFIAEEDTENLVYPLDSYEKNKLKFEVDAGLVEIDLLELEKLEKLDADAVRFKMLEFRKLWRNIFNLYSNCLKGFQRGADFNQIKDQLSRISRMEFWKFIKDYGLTNFITQEEIAILFKLINTRMKKVHSDLSYLDYEGHKELMMQSIYLMFTRPPIDMSHLPPSFTIDKFVEIVKKKYKDEGLKTDFFEDANKYSVLSDPQVVDYLNGELAKDPNFPLPHTYEKIVEKKVEYRPKLCEALKVADSYEVCYSIVADMVKAITE